MENNYKIGCMDDMGMHVHAKFKISKFDARE
jgi:hypothetical protein